MNNIKTWFVENKLAASIALVFLIGVAGLGYLSWNAWSDYGAAKDDYDAQAAKIAELAKIKPFPSDSNLKKLNITLNQSKSNLNDLNTAMARFTILPFGEIQKAKVQDQPQLFQDTLRTQVTAIKTLAGNKGSTLPPSFYLGLDDFENRLPLPEQISSLARQLSVLNWLATTIISKKEVILAEFSRVQTGPSLTGSTTPKNIAPKPYETLNSVRFTMRCSQPAFRETINAIASAPYFMIIEDIKVQNSGTEPPHRNSAGTADGAAAAPTDGTAQIQRIPVIVGRESLNVSLKVRILDFPQSQQAPDSLK